MIPWQVQLNAEFARAASSRAAGNEGQARVCARRAAGLAIRESLQRRGIRPPSTSSYDLLQLLQQDPRLPAEMKSIARHLTLRVTEAFELPVEADLLAEARRLCKWLLPEWEE
jgi:HEPN domain-containing protein